MCLWAFATLLPLGCGYTDPGSGTHALEVIMTLSYSAGDPSKSTAVEVSVNKGGVAAPAPDILLTDTDTGETFNINQTRGPKYVGSVTGYRRHIGIKVTSATDMVTCQIEAPGRHTVGSPLATANLSASNALDVSWITTDGLKADEIDISLENSNYGPTTLVDDSGDFAILPSVLRTGNETVTVVRRNKLIPAGGTGNSSVQAQYGVPVNFTLD